MSRRCHRDWRATGTARPAVVGRGCLPICLFTTLLTVGCATEEGDWADAQASASAAGYETFLAKRPDSRHAPQALDEIWVLMDKHGEGRVTDYEAFLTRHPNSTHSQAALDRIWALTAQAGTITAYEGFLERHGATPHAQDAINGIWAETIKLNTIAAYEAFAAKYARDSLAEKAKAAVGKLWTSLRPAMLECVLTSELSVDVSWQPTQGADSYVLYWSPTPSFRKDKKRSEAVESTGFTHTARVGEYGAQLPMYYRVAAVKNGMESALSDASVAKLLPDNDGTRCQICGGKAIGYCHLREIHVCDAHNAFTADDGTNWQCP